MELVVHRADDRGSADRGWLKARHSFSFASYQDPEKMGFGLLRVINDDRIAPGKGFGTHPHENMEIITVPLSGVLNHKDSVGNEASIRAGEVQLMSAGTGVTHSEFNGSENEECTLLQIWVMPEKINIAPRYDQKSFTKEGRQNEIQKLVSPIGKGSGEVEINQQAYFSRADLEADKELSYKMNHSGHGLYVFLISGSLQVSNQALNKRDALGITGALGLSMKALEDSEVLFIETPMS